MSKRIAVILPHLDSNGGVRRFLEIGNILIDRGYEYIIYKHDLIERQNNAFVSSSTLHRPLLKVDWFDYRGPIKYLDGHYQSDITMCGDPYAIPLLNKFSGKKYVYMISDGTFLSPYLKYIGDPNIHWILNNPRFLEHMDGAAGPYDLVYGGVNTNLFKLNRKFKVGIYGRIPIINDIDIKGTQALSEALAEHPNVDLIGFRDLSNTELPEAYRDLDYFVVWEQQGGWSNMAAEALACGTPVITNGINCEPFINRCIQFSSISEVVEFFNNPMQEFSWENVVDKLEHIWSKEQ